MSRDPLAAITREPFDYAANNPLRFTDPSGLDIVEELGGPGIPCLFCEVSRASQELLEPPFEEAGNGASWLLNQLGTEELDEGEFENPEPCLEPPVDPNELKAEKGVPSEAMDKAAQQVAQEEFSRGSNPANPHGNGPRGKQAFGALARLLGAIIHRPGP